jgi:Probable molybdopterin binding domain
MAISEPVAIGVVTISDRASAGTYQDTSGPAIEEFLRKAVTTPWRAVRRLVHDGIDSVRNTLIDLADREKCALIFTTGGTARSDPGRHARRLHASDAGLRRTDALGELERGADRDLIKANRRHSRIDIDRQSARTTVFDPDDYASSFSGDPLLPRLDRGCPHRYRSRALQGIPAAAIGPRDLPVCSLTKLKGLCKERPYSRDDARAKDEER